MKSEELGQSFGYITPFEIQELKRFTKEGSPVVVNIGAGAGTSGLAFMESNSSLFLYTIDVTDESSPFGCLHAERIVFSEAGFKLNVRNNQICCDSKIVGKRWSEFVKSINHLFVDLVFIDGDHSYNGCRGDVESWHPNVKTGGYLLIHDYNKEKVFRGIIKKGQPHPAAWLEVDRVVNEMLKDTRFKHITTVDSLIVFQKT